MTALRSPRFQRPVVIVAEALRRVRWPPPPSLDPGLPAPVRQVVAAIARTLAPPLAPDRPPAFLRSSQVVACRRVLAALDRHGGALVAEPVGTGKTFIALAAAALRGGRAVAIVPATLRDQWQRAAARVGVEIDVQTHEGWSRAPRTLSPGLVIIDESHRFRNPATRRHGHLSRALVDRTVVLLTATPIVNRLEDLAHQLLLGVRDDAFAGAGVWSLLHAMGMGEVPDVLADVVIAGTTDPPRPAVLTRWVAAGEDENVAGERILAAIDRLRLSPAPPIRALLRSGFAAAAASSPRALLEALTRYRLLLLHARDAESSGRSPGRSDVRRAMGAHPDQTILWEMFEAAECGIPLDPSDLDRLTTIIGSVREVASTPDAKAARLGTLLADGRHTLVFVNSIATVHHLRSCLTPVSRVAWCTGPVSGIGHARVPRRSVLAWFGLDRKDPTGLGPRILVTTDLAAEGLDLQGAGRIVHYDLPWTVVRLDQRVGRAARIGSAHRVIDAVRFDPPPSIERRLRRAAALLRKGPLPRRIGLGAPAEHPWRWRARAAAMFAGEQAIAGTAAVRAARPGALAGVELRSGDQVVLRLAVHRVGTGPWVSRPARIEEAITTALTATALPVPDVGATLRSLARLVGRCLHGAAGHYHQLRPPGPDVRAALARLRSFAAQALRDRDGRGLELAERGFAFLRRGHTSGERALATGVAAAGQDELPAILAGLPTDADVPRGLTARVTGLVLFLADP